MSSDEHEDEQQALLQANKRTTPYDNRITNNTTQLGKLRAIVLISILFTLPGLIWINSVLSDSFEQQHTAATIDTNENEFDSIITPDITYSIHNLSVLPKLTHLSQSFDSPDNLDSTAHYITILDYTQYLYHAYLFPNCHQRNMREEHEICRCFHEYYQPALLPYPADVTDVEQMSARSWVYAEFKRRMKGYTDNDVALLEAQIKHYQPNLTEFQSMTFQSSNASHSSVPPASNMFEQAYEWFTTSDTSIPSRSSDSSSQSPSSKYRLYIDPFTESQADIAATFSSASVSNLSIIRVRDHIWTINKWVEHHHIAHWAQKLLMMQATYGHWANACARSFRTSRESEHKVIHDEPEAGPFASFQQCATTNRSDPDVLSCMPPINGMLFHDTAYPITNHMENILNITAVSLQQWINNANSRFIQKQLTCLKRSGDKAGTPITQTQSESWFSSLFSSNVMSDHRHVHPVIEPSPLSSIDTFAVAGHTWWWQDLFQRWSEEIIADRNVQNRHLPPYRNINEFHCIDRVTLNPAFGLLAESAYDTTLWRRTAHEWYNIPKARTSTIRNLPDLPIISSIRSPWLEPHPVAEVLEGALDLLQCPPPNAVIITRPDRRFLNLDAITSMLWDRYRIRPNIVQITSETSSDEQAKIFAQSGLILAPHSSQLINVLFAHPGAAVIEITGEFYNLDFARYATSMGVFFRYALGGEFENADPPDPLMQECHAQLVQCDGDPFCFKDKEWWACKQTRNFPNKNKAFNASLVSIDRAVRRSLEHLLAQCYGRFGDSRISSLDP